MAITLADALAPAGGQTFYLLEDIYIRGGLQVRDDIKARDAIEVANLKIGALVLTIDDGKIWKCKTLSFPTRDNPTAEEKVEWEQLALGGGGGGNSGGTVGVNKRIVVIKTVEGLRTGQSMGFTLEMATSAIWLRVEVSRPVRVTAFGTPETTETNPYMFLATADHLVDDGTQLFEDGSSFRSRNFSILANMQSPPTNNIYFIVDNVDTVETPVVLTITYLPLEYAAPVEETAETPTTTTPVTTPK